MGMKIYTYSNPYELTEEPFWNEICDCAHFCVSQTMVNGIKSVYPALEELKSVTTVRNLVNALYKNWEDIAINVQQIMCVDNAISKLTSEKDTIESIKRSLLFNTKSIALCIRLFKELDLDCELMEKNNLNISQQYIVDLYRIIEQDKSNPFNFEKKLTEEKVNESIIEALLKDIKKGEDIDINKINTNTIVIHGVHQFTPALLSAIEELLKYKEVILLFNYQEQYHSIYDTWLRIYRNFECDICINNENQFTPLSLLVDSYSSNVLADNIGRLANGDTTLNNEPIKDIKIIEFENTMEFANYIAYMYDDAKNKAKNMKSPMSLMPRYFYSASTKVNDILRAYFPDQFGERHFLDYPLGHFFVSTTNMWNEEKKKVIIEDFSDIKECLNSGIIKENEPGSLVSSFNMIEPYIEKEKNLIDINEKIDQLIKNANKSHSDKDKIGYFTVKVDKLIELKNALSELNQIIESFFLDFDDDGENFKRFYSRIRKFIISKTSDMNDLDDEMKQVITRLLGRLEKSDLPGTGTFNALKHTMSYYLSQDENVNKGARWIVRGFDQIDGDILRSSRQDSEKIKYHFCCLSDKDICSNKDERLPWPLDIRFFEYVHPAYDWKYQIFLRSKMEYSRFKTYALLYGLEFNRVGLELSYIKNENGKENSIHYLLDMIGIPIKKYSDLFNNNYLEKLEIEKSSEENLDDIVKQIHELDRIKWTICPYKFALERVAQNGTIYRDRFLIHNYMKILLSNRVKNKLSGQIYDNNMIEKTIQDEYENIRVKFRISDELEKTQLISSVFIEIKSFIKANRKFNKQKNLFPIIDSEKQYEQRMKEYYLFVPKNIDMNCVTDDKMKEVILGNKFNCKHNNCKYCASKDICLEDGVMTGGD